MYMILNLKIRILRSVIKVALRITIWGLKTHSQSLEEYGGDWDAARGLYHLLEAACILNLFTKAELVSMGITFAE